MIYTMLFKSLRDSLTSLLLWIGFIIPFLLIIVIPCGLFRLFVHFLAKKLRPELIPITKFSDGLLTFIPSRMEPQLNTCQVWRVKGKVNVDEFREHFRRCFLSTEEDRRKYVNLSCCVVEWMFYCFKKPVTLDLEDHIRGHSLEEGVTLEGFVGEYMADGRFVRVGRETGVGGYKEVPDWEILVLDNVPWSSSTSTDFKDESVLLFNISHALTDGYTFMHFVEKFSGNQTPYAFKEEKMPLFEKIKLTLRGPPLLLKYLRSLRSSKDVTGPPVPKKPKSPFKWFISFETVDLELVKNIRRRTGSHFNSVLQSAFIGALRRHFLETSRISKVSELPDRTNVGSSLGWPEHPVMIGKAGMTNHFTIGSFKIPLRTDDALERLKLADEDYKEFHSRNLHKLMYYLVFGLLWALPAWFNRFSRNHGNLGVLRNKTYVSPLMASSQPYKLLGHDVRELYLPLQSSSGDQSISMVLIPVSHSGKVGLSINASSEIIKDQEELDRFTKVLLVEELKKLHTLVDL